MNQRGMAQLVMAFSLAIGTFFLISYGSKLSLSAHQHDSRERRHEEIALVAENISALLQSNEVWFHTISSQTENPSFACLREDGDCCGKNGESFKIVGLNDSVYYDAAVHAFNRRGERCTTYGTDGCNFKPQLTWSAMNKGSSPLCHDVVISMHMEAHGSDKVAKTFNLDLQSAVIYREPSSDDMEIPPPSEPEGTCKDIQKNNKLVQYGLSKTTPGSPWHVFRNYCFISRIGKAGYDFASSLGLSCFYYIDSSGDQRIVCPGGYKDMNLDSATTDYQKARYLAFPDFTQPKESCSGMGWINLTVAGVNRCRAPNAAQPGGVYLRQALNAGFTYCKHIIGGKVGAGIPVWCEGNFAP